MFLDNVCRSTCRVKSWYSGTYFLARPYCVYDGADQTITFKMYNHDTDEEMECDYTNTTTGADMIVGAANNSIVLNFVHETPVQNYEIVVSANPAEGGTVSGNGTYEAGANATVTAEPAEGYTFVNWTEDGTEVSTEASYTFEVTAARTLVANFEGGSSEPDYPWVVVDPNEGAYNAELWAIVQINGEMITDGTNWEVGAFYGDICRGLANMENGWVPIAEEDQGDVPYTNYLVMMLYGNNGEELNFKLYDLEAGQVHPGVCDVTVTYQHDAAFGDPWEPIILNFVTEQCFTLDIDGYDDKEGGYYLVASPIEEDLDPVAVGMITENYDLYWFNQNPQDEVGLEWINYKQGAFNLTNGKGYLYASKEDVQLSFCGTAYNGNGEVTLVKEEGPNAEFSGWNLVGNPFPVAASIDRDCYVMQTNADGTSEVVLSKNRTIPAMNGIFVTTNVEEETMTFVKGESSDGQGKLVINMKQERGNVIDRAMVRLGESRTLPKFMLNESNTKVYIPQDGNDFAVVASRNEEQMPVNFKASANGTYTLSVDVENATFEHLTLIDHLTGAQVNLLSTPNYQFSANTNDPESRFTISFRSNTSVVSDETFNPICYRQNGQLVITNFEGEGTLQMVDMLGRILSSNKIQGEYATEINMVAGVYTIRLITNDKTYTQKIVVE